MPTEMRQRFVEAAFELFARNGFHAIGLDRVIDEVGVSKQTFYNHFDSKDDLIIEVLKHRSAWELQTLRTMLRQFGGDSPRGQLLAIFDVLNAWLNDREFRGCIFITAAAEFPAQHDPAHLAAAEHASAVRLIFIELCQDAGIEDAQGLSERIHLLVEGAFVLRHVTGNTQAAQVARSTADLLLAQYLPDPEPAITQ